MGYNRNNTVIEEEKQKIIVATQQKANKKLRIGTEIRQARKCSR